MSSLFRTEPISKTEEDIIAEVFRNSAVKKYIRILALNDTIELLRLGSINRSDAEIGKALATVQGKLSVYEMLLSIEERNPEGNPTVS